MKNNTIEITNNLHTVTSLIGQMTLPASVYRAPKDEYFKDNDCTNGGISAAEDELLVLDADGFIPITIENLHKVVSVCNRQGFRYVSPVVRNPLNHRGQRKDVGPMFGGNFLYSCDSRFSARVCDRPIAIHDRWETQEDYDILSR